MNTATTGRRTLTCIDCGTARILTGNGNRDRCGPCAQARDGKERRAQTPGSWAQAGLCSQVDPELWFPEKGGSPVWAKRICRRCTVAEKCLAWSLETDQEFGVWGGLTRKERLELVGRRAAA